MYTFFVNGNRIQTEINKKLLPFIRENLGLKGTKDGCSEGACGTCTVIIDGKAMKSCLPTTEKMDGRSVTTIEGLSEREQAVYSHCFAEAGAVQCGFCTPGMIMSAKALLDVNDNPTKNEVKKAIRGNVCRCTGYVKIEEAILMAAKFFRENLEIPNTEHDAHLSRRFRRVDAVDKALGKGVYVDDLVIEGTIHAKALRSAYPRARVKSIDISAALAHPDAISVLLASDVPENKIGHIEHDWDVLIPVGGTTRYIGDALALVASKRQESLEEILKLIHVDYEILEPVTTTKQAMDPDAPKLHKKGNVLTIERLKRGDADAAIAKSKYVVTKTYHTPFTEHAFMEPECAIALPEDDGLLVYTASQSIFDEQREIARMLKLPKEKIHCQTKLVGGGFGGKEDMSVQHHAALMAWHIQRPVKVKLSRQESINIHPKRHAMEMEFTTACDENGRLTGMKALLISDTGAYASLGGPVLQRACTHAAGPYNYQDVDIVGKAVYTNNVPGGAFRGFGVTQSCFAMENNLNLLADMVGISPWEIRFRNAIRPGEVLPNGQIADPNTALDKCLLAVKSIFEANGRTGIACAFKNSGFGVGVPDVGRCTLSVEDGTIHIRTSAACMGQGLATVATQIVCETIGIAPEKTFCEPADTRRTPDAGTSTASRQTVITGEAIRRVANKLKEALEKTGSLSDLEGQEFYDEFTAITDPLGSDKPNPKSHIAYSYSTQVVQLDEQGKVEKVTAAVDVGTVVNPTAVEGQVEGGVVMGLGYALTEDYPIEGGYPKVKYGTLGLFRATEAPDIETITVKNDEVSREAYGAKGIGELSTIATAPAVQNAYFRFDGEFRTTLPLPKTAYRKEKV
ncbi:selenium-dependent xanthine dehydrogenase [Pleomorphochaeta sp. DL1XJH-081]|uniref:selenium-dependent xanthine dehydrogenase n=1 Tax=Pleomorphochaeta sp. DL1XJH-081 TaxID=3409690 RepID=UPI003BB78A84